MLLVCSAIIGYIIHNWQAVKRRPLYRIRREMWYITGGKRRGEERHASLSQLSPVVPDLLQRPELAYGLLRLELTYL